MLFTTFSRSRNSSYRSAFTLVELLVVIAIIGILVSLLLPAVQSAREAARRISCVSKMKNIALAVLNHHDVQGHFPISQGSRAGLDAAEGEGPGGGWILQVLPQIEEQALFDQFNQGGAFEGVILGNPCVRGRIGLPGENGIASANPGVSAAALMASQLPLLQCPSDISVTQLSTEQFGWFGCGVATTSYKGVIGDPWLGESDSSPFSNDLPNPLDIFSSGLYNKDAPAFTTQRDCHRDTRCRGIFFRQSFRRPVKISRITDGTSNTFMIGEDIPEYNFHSVAFYSDGDWCSCNIPINNLINQPADTVVRDEWWLQRGFKSLHPGGANFARADGSVSFITDGVDNIAYRTACRRDSGETPPSGAL